MVSLLYLQSEVENGLLSSEQNLDGMDQNELFWMALIILGRRAPLFSHQSMRKIKAQRLVNSR
jgi:hypothetical protein